MPRPRVLINALSMTAGGGRTFLVNLLRELGRDDRGFEFTVLATRRQLEEIDTHGIPALAARLPSTGRVVWRVAYEEFLMPIRARNFDLLYCIADLAPRFSPVPVVVLLANLNVYDHRWYDTLRTRTLERLVRFGLPAARRLVVATQAAADSIDAFVPLPADRVRVVHFGIDTASFSSMARIDPPQVPYLFLPAAPEKHKNIEVLIDGLARVEDRRLELWIAGESGLDPGHRTELIQRAESIGVGERVRFLGPVPHAELKSYYRHAVALAFPSFIETFGFPLLEAMASGTPALVSDVPVFREIAREAALYFDPKDPEAVARAIDAVLRDSEGTARRVELGRERASRFTWEACVDGLASVFREALSADA